MYLKSECSVVVSEQVFRSFWWQCLESGGLLLVFMEDTPDVPGERSEGILRISVKLSGISARWASLFERRITWKSDYKSCGSALKSR